MSKRKLPRFKSTEIPGPRGKRTRRSTAEERHAKKRWQQRTDEFPAKRSRPTSSLKRPRLLSEQSIGAEAHNLSKPSKCRCFSEPKKIRASKRERIQSPAKLRSSTRPHLSAPKTCLLPKKRSSHSQLSTAVSTHAPLAKAVSPGEKPNDTLIGQSSGLSNHPDKSSDNKSRAASPPVGAPKPVAAKSVTSLFEIGDILGEGSFGQVRAARRKSDNRPVALKILPKDKILAYKKMDGGELVPEEVFYQSRVRHPAIIELLDYFWEDGHCVMVMEKPAQPCDMLDYLTDEGPLSEDLAKKIFRQLLDAAIHCEERGIFHRDIKNENIIVEGTGQGVVKLTDFGLSSAMQAEPFYDYRGTFEFCPPEFFSSRMYEATRATVWQLGCVLVEMFTLQLPYASPRDALAHPPRVPRNVSEDARDLMRQMLARNAGARPDLQQIKAHPWLKPG